MAATLWHLSSTHDHWMHTALCYSSTFNYSFIQISLIFTQKQNSIINDVGLYKFLMSADSSACTAVLHMICFQSTCSWSSNTDCWHLAHVNTHFTITVLFLVTATKQSIQLKSLLLLQHLFLYLHVCCWWIFWPQNYWFDGVLLMLMKKWIWRSGWQQYWSSRLTFHCSL